MKIIGNITEKAGDCKGGGSGGPWVPMKGGGGRGGRAPLRDGCSGRRRRPHHRLRRHQPLRRRQRW